MRFSGDIRQEGILIFELLVGALQVPVQAVKWVFDDLEGSSLLMVLVRMIDVRKSINQVLYCVNV